MWSRNLVNTIQTVAQAVAPPLDSEDDDDEYDDEEEYTDDEEDEYAGSSSQHDDKDADRPGTRTGGRLGFVGLLTRAMDRHASDDDEEEEEDVHPQVNGFDKDSAATNIQQFASANYSSDEESLDQLEAAALEVEPDTPTPQMMSPQMRESGSVHSRLLKAATPEVLQQLHMLKDDDESTTDRRGGHDHNLQPLESPVLDASLTGGTEDVTTVEPMQQAVTATTNGDGQFAANGGDEIIPSTAPDGPKTEYLVEPEPTIHVAIDDSDNVGALIEQPETITMLNRETQVATVEPDSKAAEESAQPRAMAFKRPPPPVTAAKMQQSSSPAPTKMSLPKPPSPRPAVSAKSNDVEQPQQQQVLEDRCRQLEEQLAKAQQELAIRNTSKADDLDVLAEQIQQQESKQLQLAQQTHQQEMETVTRQFDARIEQLQRDMQQEQKAFDKERQELLAQLHSQADVHRVEQEFTKQQKQLIETMTLLDEREHQVLQLRQTIKNLENLLQQNKATHMENEDILEEVHQENDQLRNHVEQAEARCQVLKAKVEELQHLQDKNAHTQLELRMVKEELERERAKSQNAVVSASNSNQVLEDERDAALAMVEDLKQQLATTEADLDIARADYQRISMVNNNLQSALESFQSEREAEVSMLEEQRRDSEQALAAANAASVEAIKSTYAEQLRQVQSASDAAVRTTMQQCQQLEVQLKRYESENVQMRRSLDEAIHRLQMNQEDVIDRSLMKNILMDWLTRTGVKERRDVLELMASVLHFTDNEKERVHISTSHIASSILGKLAGPVPEAKADMENLQGDTVSEKFLNFLLAETDDE
ncbi:hypothetical protein MPSEU_000782600 [Mayamaea pseudoterrestris]|nr:hypothetical protein MPSEU_000782600 [Mayamaea pseudoterrestris]